MPAELAEDEEAGDDEQRVVRSIVAGVRALLRVQTRVMPIGARRALVSVRRSTVPIVEPYAEHPA